MHIPDRLLWPDGSEELVEGFARLFGLLVDEGQRAVESIFCGTDVLWMVSFKRLAASANRCAGSAACVALSRAGPSSVSINSPATRRRSAVSNCPYVSG